MATVATEREIREAFDVWCRQNSKLPGKDLINVLRCLGFNPTEAEVDAIYVKMNITEEMFLEFPQVQSAAGLCSRTAENPEELVEAFRVFDRHGTGCISDKELRRIMTTLGDDLSNAEADAMMAETTVDREGMVNYHDFVRKMLE
eukprot:a339655_518.p1 GENE.a339655_518~~a339655_518.p1  ORF type:complete len:160 (+),score=54.27 a339655_518:47-481(+)